MAELDSLIDSLIQERDGPEVFYIDDRYASTIKLKQTPSKGQGVFAEKFLSMLNPICSLNYPTMMAVDLDFIPTTCYHCLVITATQLPLPCHGYSSVALKTCNGCHLARFCNKDCQVKAWHSYHKYECKIFKKVQSDLPATFRAVMRVVLLKDRNILPSQEWNRITRLTSHEHRLAARGRTDLTDMAEGIKLLTESEMSIEIIQRLIFIMKSNATELPTPIHGGIGVMLDPLVAKFNHSCEPNITIHRPQQTMINNWMNSTQLSEEERTTFIQVVPLRDIQEGEELLNCYVAPTISVNVRKTKCREDYFFDCNCPQCLSDLKAAADLAEEQPNLSPRYQQWTTSVIRHLSRLKQDPSAFQKAATAMSKSNQFLDHPFLYTTGDFPQMAMGIIKEGLTMKAHAVDEALINLLRLYFLVNPERFVGRHNPTNIYTSFLVLDVFDAILLLGISNSTPSGISSSDSPDDRREETWLHNLSTRGMSKNSLIYWRRRICADLRKRVEGSALKDLLVLVEQRRVAGDQILIKEEEEEEEEETSSLEETIAEQEMGTILGLTEPRWKIVLRNTSGC